MITVPFLSVLTTYFAASAVGQEMKEKAYLGFAGSSGSSSGTGAVGDLLSGDLGALCLCANMSAE